MDFVLRRERSGAGPARDSLNRCCNDRTHMRSKYLFVVTAVVEAGTGLALVLRPSVPVALLLGSPLSMTAEVTLGRIAGAAVLSLGLACWLAE